MNQGAGSCFFMLPFLKASFYPRTVALPLWKAIAPRGIIWGLSLGLLCIIIPEGKSSCQASPYSPLAKAESHAHSQTNHSPRGRRLPGTYTPIRPRGWGRSGASRQEVRDSAKCEGLCNCWDCVTPSHAPPPPLSIVWPCCSTFVPRAQILRIIIKGEITGEQENERMGERGLISEIAHRRGGKENRASEPG